MDYMLFYYISFRDAPIPIPGIVGIEIGIDWNWLALKLELTGIGENWSEIDVR